MLTFSVSEFITIVNRLLKEMWNGETIAIEGEISGYRLSQGQWVSFDLKDDTALVNVFLPAWNLNVPIQDGMRVRVIGFPRVYPKYGKFSLSADRIELIGEGALRKALAELRMRLEKEGLFDVTRKRELPRFPSRIALIASRESAAYGDFIRILKERWGGLEIDLYHVLVQGDRAAQEIVGAIQCAQQDAYDVLVMTRGGGSLEELMAFNDERVVRAIHGSRVPTLVAIGHERDLTLAEEAADVRGSTPTDCARRLVPDRRDVLFEVASLMDRMEQSLGQEIECGTTTINRAMHAPVLWMNGQRHRIAQIIQMCETSIEDRLRALQDRLTAHLRLLASLDPKSVLARGYVMLRDANGHGLVERSQLKIDQSIEIVLRDGSADAKILNVHPDRTQSTLF